jgi:hypothetical protein
LPFFFAVSVKDALSLLDYNDFSDLKESNNSRELTQSMGEHLRKEVPI